MRIMSKNQTSLDQLPDRKAAKICGFLRHPSGLVEKLREIGFAEGDEVEVLHRGLFGGSPLSVRVNRSLIALRKHEAAQIMVLCS
jgi:ferrous iron transport protein A